VPARYNIVAATDRLFDDVRVLAQTEARVVLRDVRGDRAVAVPRQSGSSNCQ